MGVWAKGSPNSFPRDYVNLLPERANARRARPSALGAEVDALREWMAKQNTQLVIKAARPGALAGMPVGKPGRGRLLIPWGDRAVAKQLVDSIVQQPLRDASRHDPGIAKEHLPGQIPDPDRTRMEITMPAVGLLLTGIVALVSCFLWTVGVAHEGLLSTQNIGHSLYSLLPTVFGLWAAGCLIAGAVHMMRCARTHWLSWPRCWPCYRGLQRGSLACRSGFGVWWSCAGRTSRLRLSSTGLR